MSIVLNGVTARETWESYRKGRDANGPTVQKQYLVPFLQADLFVDSLMGGTIRQGNVIHYTPRQTCPENPLLYCTGAYYEGVAETDLTGDSRPLFQMARVTVNYGVLTWDFQVSDDPGGENSFPNDETPGEPWVFATQEIDIGGEFVLMPNSSLKFLSDNTPVNIPLGKWTAHATLRFTRHYVPYFPVALVLSKLNKINSSQFLGQPTGQIRFANCKTKRVANSDGTRTQEVELVFEWREADWNKYLRPDAPVYDAVGGITSGQPYQYDDLSPLLLA